jgi:pimeloyl-ACP methyl ester carboxylesterase
MSLQQLSQKSYQAFLTVNELPRVIAEKRALRWVKPLLNKMPDGDGHGVMVIPGFLGEDSFNKPLCDFLISKGYVASGWRQGRNLGPKDEVIAQLTRELEFLYKQTGRPITIIGHSLGGVYAREIARSAPAIVRQIITLGSPITQSKGTTLTSGLFRRLNPSVNHGAAQKAREIAPPVPITSVYTKTDSVVHWKNAMQQNGHTQTENIEVHGSHCGLTVNGSVWYLIAERLAQAQGQWQPFERSMLIHNWVFPQRSI